MFVQMIVFPEQQRLLGRFISDGQLEKQAADDGKSERTKENMQTALKKVAWVQELMECMCVSRAAGKPSTHRWCNGTDLPLRRLLPRQPGSTSGNYSRSWEMEDTGVQ